MTPGTVVWAAWEGMDGVEVGEARVVRVLSNGWVSVDRPMLGRRDFLCRETHATRTAALEALAERLEESAREDQRLAAEFTVRWRQRLIQAEQAKRMAGEGR